MVYNHSITKKKIVLSEETKFILLLKIIIPFQLLKLLLKEYCHQIKNYKNLHQFEIEQLIDYYCYKQQKVD